FESAGPAFMSAPNTSEKAEGVRVSFTTCARKYQLPPCRLRRTSSPTRIARSDASFHTGEWSSTWRLCTRGDGRVRWLLRGRSVVPDRSEARGGTRDPGGRTLRS